MKKILYIFRNFLWLLVMLIWIVAIIINSAKGTSSDTIFAMTLFGLITTYVSFLVRPNKHKYAPSGEKWDKKFTFKETTTQTKSHKDGAFEIYYFHHFTVSCTSVRGETMTYDLVKNGGVSGKDKNGHEYSKKVSEKLFLKNRDILEDEKN